MASEAYELLALLMRYIFVLIGALVLWRAYRWLRRDARAYKREMRALPDAGLVGEMVNLNTGESQPLPREGTIGSSRECDIRVKGTGVQRTHARFAFEEGKGLRVTPSRGAKVVMAGVALNGPAHALHGTQLQIGDALLRVRLFAGLKVPHPMQFQQDALLQQSQEEDDAPWAALDPAPDHLSPFEFPENDPPEGAPAYQGNYTEDGQMTWQYAYSLDELRAAQEAQAARQSPYQPPYAAPPSAPLYPQETDEGGDEAVPYESPLPRRRRRSRS